MLSWRTGAATGILLTMPDHLRPLLELGVFAAALVLAGLATLLQRRPEPILDWPPSPPPPPHVRRDLIVTSAAVLFLVAGVGVGTLALTIGVFVRLGGA